jgi:heptosyltransferase-2
MKPTFISRLRGTSAAPLVVVRYPNWIGDAVMAIPALEAVSKSMPAARLAVLAKPWVAEVVRMSNLAGEVVVFEEPGRHAGVRGRVRLASELRGRRFDAAVLFQNAFEAALIAVLAGIPLRGGYSTDARAFLLTHPVRFRPKRDAGEHHVFWYLRMVGLLGFDAQVGRVPRLTPPGPPPRSDRYAVLAPGATFGSAKMWPADRWVELGRRFARQGLAVVLLGSGGETAICRAIAEDIGPAAQDLSGRTTLSEAASILAGAVMVVSNDSGLMHLAAALDAPLTALFGPTDPHETGPVSRRSVVVHGEAPCAPCRRRTCPRNRECFDAVTVERVAAAAVDLMERTGHDG